MDLDLEYDQTHVLRHECIYPPKPQSLSSPPLGLPAPPQVVPGKQRKSEEELFGDGDLTLNCGYLYV